MPCQFEAKSGSVYVVPSVAFTMAKPRDVATLAQSVFGW